MLDALSFGAARIVEPRKMDRKAALLPLPVQEAFDQTPVGEARLFPVAVPEGADKKKLGTLLVSLLDRYAKAQGYIAFKSTAEIAGDGIELYWQKKEARKKGAPVASPEAAAAFGETFEAAGRNEASPEADLGSNRAILREKRSRK